MKSILAKSLALFLIINFSTIAQRKNMPLKGNWFFKESRNSQWLLADVPGTVHTDLLKHKKIGDPFWRDNEKFMQWVSNQHWDYQTIFEVSDETLQQERIELVFPGIDTYADIFLNGNLILKCNNMFTEWRASVKNLLKSGPNTLLLRFTSPMHAELDALQKDSISLPAINDAMPLKLSPYMRKSGYHFGWDWGPRYVTSGIFLPVSIETYNEAKIKSSFIQTESITKSEAILKGWIEIENFSEKELTLKLTLNEENEQKTMVSMMVGGKEKGIQKIPFVIKVKKPKLWWPNGLGAPFLYTFGSQLFAGSSLLDTKEEKIGIRTLEVIHESDKMGKSLYLKVNGEPVFMKGANYIPQDNFITRVSLEKYQKTIQSVKSAHMNMLRVWGGGFYEKDEFYELCDANGILIWQDFMFACTFYDRSSTFKNRVNAEVNYQVRRLRNHPSLALWCGNNENETGWFKRWVRNSIPFSKADSQLVYEDYKSLFHHQIPALVSKEDPSRFYTRSSPSANDDAILPDKIGYGDIHDWYVWFGTGDYRAYKKNVSRFNSEYGYQSFPDFVSIKKFSEPQDWFEDSDVMDVHQKHPNGNAKIKRFSAQFYNKPKDFKSFIYISQLQQAEAMKLAIETHRSRMPYCMGSLYWQLNDCWPAASWSSIDYYGKWKAAHYFIKEANKPLHIVNSLDGDSIKIVVLNDQLQSLKKYTIKLEVKDFFGTILWSKQIAIQQNANSAKEQFKWNVNELIGAKSKNEIYFSSSLNGADGKIIAQNLFYLVEPKLLKLASKPEIKHTFTHIGKETFIEISSDVLVKNLCLHSDDIDFHASENYFDLQAKEVKRIKIESENDVTNKIQISSLVDSFEPKP